MAAVTTASAQVMVSSLPFDYIETFSRDGGWPAGPMPWRDNETFPGWFAAYYNSETNTLTTPTHLVVTSGAADSASRLNLYRGDADAGTGSLGAQPDDANTPLARAGGVFYGVRLVNRSDHVITTFQLDMDVGLWRLTTTPRRQPTLTAAFRVGGESLDGGEWVLIPGATYTTPKAGGSGGARSLDGNAAENVVRFEGLRPARPIHLPPGEALWIRWFDVNNRSFDHGVGLNSVAVRFPSPSQ